MHRLIPDKVSRREFVSKFIGASVVTVPLAAVLAGCVTKSENENDATTGTSTPTDCRDLTGVSKEDLATRKKFAYVNKSPIPDNQCGNCKLYLPPGGEKKCGGCLLFKGPVEVEGYCTYWAPIV